MIPDMYDYYVLATICHISCEDTAQRRPYEADSALLCENKEATRNPFRLFPGGLSVSLCGRSFPSAPLLITITAPEKSSTW